LPRTSRKAAARDAPGARTDAHQTDSCAELVCSNSFRSDDAEHNAVGLLHEEMRRAGSLIMRAADAHKLPAGGALAVDRDGFSDAVTAALRGHPLVSSSAARSRACRRGLGQNVIVATGPLTSRPLAEAIQR
jgi:methylenetetrahydrofolate--tRNA-(uracil-5-)-methyltransferase